MGEITQRENEWLDRATSAAINAARGIVLGDDAAIPMTTPVGRLSDVEWGWIVAAVIFAWVTTRAAQATVEGRDVEMAIRDGVDGACLPALADTPGIDWTKPLIEWPRETMIDFLLKTLGLAKDALAARDCGPGITRKSADTVLTV
jgi:hypothetical protein